MKEVTEIIGYKYINGRVYQITTCYCGAEVALTIHARSDEEEPIATKNCPKCGRSYMMYREIHVYEV